MVFFIFIIVTLLPLLEKLLAVPFLLLAQAYMLLKNKPILLCVVIAAIYLATKY